MRLDQLLITKNIPFIRRNRRVHTLLYSRKSLLESLYIVKSTSIYRVNSQIRGSTKMLSDTSDVLHLPVVSVGY